MIVKSLNDLNSVKTIYEKLMIKNINCSLVLREFYWGLEFIEI